MKETRVPGRSATSGPAVALRIHALLHTMRVIQQHEDEFCTLMHTLQKTGKLTAADSFELHALLDRMPGEAFQQDLDALRDSLRPRPSRKPAQPGSHPVAHA